jgi:hypothetical protein
MSFGSATPARVQSAVDLYDLVPIMEGLIGDNFVFTYLISVDHQRMNQSVQYSYNVVGKRPSSYVASVKVILVYYLLHFI